MVLPQRIRMKCLVLCAVGEPQYLCLVLCPQRMKCGCVVGEPTVVILVFIRSEPTYLLIVFIRADEAVCDSLKIRWLPVFRLTALVEGEVLFGGRHRDERMLEVRVQDARPMREHLLHEHALAGVLGERFGLRGSKKVLSFGSFEQTLRRYGAAPFNILHSR